MKASLLALMAGLFWGVGEFFTKQVLHTHRVGPVTAIAVRSTVALPVLGAAYLLVVHGRGVEPRDWTQAGAGTLLKLVLGSGLAAGAGGMLCFYGALNLGPISKVKPVAFTLAPVADYPASFDIDHPATLSRGLVLVKWWLLAIPHYIVIGILGGAMVGDWSDIGRDGGPGGVPDDEAHADWPGQARGGPGEVRGQRSEVRRSGVST